MGKPGGGHAPSPTDESIVCEEGTRGTETSKYPEEKKVRTISLVVASERERAQTESLRRVGVEDRQKVVRSLVEHGWKAGPKRVTVP